MSYPLVKLQVRYENNSLRSFVPLRDFLNHKKWDVIGHPIYIL